MSEQQPEDIKLQAWEGRFFPSRYKCPECGGAVLEDRWPPNYFHGVTSINPETGVFSAKSGGHIKCVCKACRLALVWHVYEEQTNDEQTRTETIHSTTPLVERDGVWLTPHDVWREDYKDEHGEYPFEAYG